MGSVPSTTTTELDTDFNDILEKPGWACTVRVRDEFLSDNIAQYSDEFRSINANVIELIGTGNNRIHGAQWSRGFTSGRHVVEFVYPKQHRGAFTRVGLGHRETKLSGNKLKDILGGQGSWAIDLVTRRAIADGKSLGFFPPSKPLPDWFFMYIDLDLGELMFGSDTVFCGVAFTTITAKSGPLYPMVTASCKGAVIGIVYRGEGKVLEGPLRTIRSLADVRRRKKKRR